MPDLKSEMSKVLNLWGSPEANPQEAPVPVPKVNATQLTFNYVRDNPGLSRQEVAAATHGMGVPKSSASSLITQLLRNENLRESNGLLYVNQLMYSPRKPVLPPKRQMRTTRAVSAPSEPVAVSMEWSVAAVLDSLNIRQARAVYDELRGIFGG
jgi:hypothetical protein